MIGDIVDVHRCECVADGGHFQEWDEYGKVVSITEYYITIKYIGREEDYDFEDVNGEDINPIPLTPEILENNGFTGGEYKSYTGDVWYLKEEGFRKIGLTMSRKESTLWGEKIKPLSPDSIGHNFAVPNIKYVHELQHALRLCGINKEIII